MNNINRATGASALLNILIKDAPLWYKDKSFLLPAQMEDLIGKKPLLDHVSSALFFSNTSFDSEKLHQSFISSGAFREVCRQALLGELAKSEYEWEQFNDIARYAMPKSITDAVLGTLQIVSTQQPPPSHRIVESFSVFLEYQARVAVTTKPSAAHQTILDMIRILSLSGQ